MGRLGFASLIGFRPAGDTLTEVRSEAARCKNCPLWKLGTQTVFGEGPAKAKVMFVGEQPGNQEDLEGRPFVGPAGGILNAALEEAGIARTDTYVTNAVKHFKWEPRGKKRIHKKPNGLEIAACRPWLDAELDLVRPEVVVCLGATAAQSLIGKDFRVTEQHGQWVQTALSARVTATIHPSSILRSIDDKSRHAAMRLFVDDLKKVARVLR